MNGTGALEALELLREGNRRFVSGASGRDMSADLAVRQKLVAGQQPFAAVLGCSDSRVPTEIVFDRGPGDLFVIRVAGNVVAPSLVGSVEFAAEMFGTRLVVVLGHTMCGAVEATVDELLRPGGSHSPGMRSIVDRIRPAVEELVTANRASDREALMAEAIRANVSQSAARLRHGSAIIERLIEDEGLLVVGAEYSLESGEVAFFDGVPDAPTEAL